VNANRTTGILVVAGGAAAALGYAWTIVTGRLVTTAEYSDFSAGVSIIYFAVTALAPLAQTVAYFTASFLARGEREAAAALQWRILRISLLAGAVAIPLSAIAAGPLSRALRMREPADIVLVAASLALIACLQARRGVQLGEQRFGSYSFNLAFESGLRITVAIALLLAWPHASSGLTSYAISVAVATWLAGGWPHRAASTTDRAAVLRYFVPALVQTAIYAAFQNIDVLFVKRLFPPADAGAYGAASLLARSAGMLVLPFFALAVPHFVEAESDAAELRRRFIRVCLSYALLAALAVAVLGGASSFIATLFFGARYAAAAPLLLPLSGAIALAGLVFLMCQLPAARNRFAFVGAYAAGLTLEIALLASRHGTLHEVTFVLLAANAVTLLLILPFVLSSL
jgi:O-antigen/teichoic acid export membrane protein